MFQEENNIVGALEGQFVTAKIRLKQELNAGAPSLFNMTKDVAKELKLAVMNVFADQVIRMWISGRISSRTRASTGHLMTQLPQP